MPIILPISVSRKSEICLFFCVLIIQHPLKGNAYVLAIHNWQKKLQKYDHKRFSNLENFVLG